MSKKIKRIKIIDPGTKPDVDSDFHTIGRGKTIEYVRNKYGHHNVASIITPGPFKAKNAFKSMATIYNLGFAESNKLSEMLPDSVTKESIKDYLDENNPAGEDFRNSIRGNSKLEKIASAASELDGRQRETGVHACFVGDTLIDTNLGLKTIKEIKVNDFVLTHKNQYSKVCKIMETTNNEGVIIESFNSIPTKVTTNHPFYVKSILRTKSGIVLSDPIWKEAKDLIPDVDMLGIPVNIESKLPDFNLPVDNENFWWFVGRFVGDGWFEDNTTKRKKKNKNGEVYYREDKVQNIVVSISSKDKTYNEFENVVKELFDYRISQERTTDKFYITRNRELFKFLKFFGKEAANKQVPNFVIDLPEVLLRKFLLGYISADGHSMIEKNKTIQFSTVSQKLVLGMSRVVNKVYKTSCRIRFESRDKMTIEGRDVNCRDRYICEFQTGTRPKQQSFYSDGIIWSKIKKITPFKLQEKTYNLTVENDSSYLANNSLVHNCGIIITPYDLRNHIPIQVRQSDGQVVTQWNYYDLEALGLIKMDFLGLDTVDLIDNTIKNIKKTKNIDINIDEIIQGPLNDKKTYELFQKGETTGIFQFGSPGVKEMLKAVKPEEFMELAAITAIYRPGPMGLGLHEDFAKRKNNPKERIPIHKDFIGTRVEEILKPTLASLVFQEQIMIIAKDCAGFSSREADNLRKAIGKKNQSLMDSMGPKLKEGMIKNGYTRESVDVLWDGIVGFGSYAFNKSHSVSYALNSYISAYLKANYPTEFMASYLRQQSENPKKYLEALSETKRMGLKIQSASINESEIFITPSLEFDKTIVFGFSSLKSFSKQASNSIFEERNKNGKFKSVDDFVKRMLPYDTVKASTIKTLAHVGAFDEFNVPRKQISINANKLIEKAKKMKDKEAGPSLFSMSQISPNLVNFGDDEYSFSEMVKLEADSANSFLSHHPLDYIKQKRINLFEDNSENTFYGVFISLTSKTTKTKHKFILGTIDNKISQREYKFSNRLTLGFQKYNAINRVIQKFNLTIKPEDVNKSPFRKQILEETLKILNINPQSLEKNMITKYRNFIEAPIIKLPDKNTVYKITLKKQSQYNDNLVIEDLEDVVLTFSGKIAYSINVKNKKLEDLYIQKLRENKGNDVVRLVYPTGETTDIENVKFMKGTTQYELESIEKRSL